MIKWKAPFLYAIGLKVIRMGKNNFYCVMAMPETKGVGKLLEKGKQAYLCTFTMKN